MTPNVTSGSSGFSAVPSQTIISGHIAPADHRTLVETFPHIVWMTEPDGSNIYCNQRWYEFTGLTIAQTVGRGWLSSVHPEDAPRAYEVWQKAVAGGSSYTAEARFRRASDGQYRWLQTTGLPMKDADGRIIKWIGTAVDIHDSKMAMHQLAEKEARLRAILDTEPECIKLMSIECVVLEMNPAGLAMLEADSPEQLVGKSVIGLIDPPYRLAFRELTRLVFQGDTAELDFEITGLKGTHRWLQTHATPLKDKNGNIQALLGVTRDITKRRRAEDKLRASEARFRALIENSSDAIALFNAEGQILFLSASTEQILGFRPDEVMGLNALDLVHPEDRAVMQQGLQQAASHPGEAITLCARGLRKDGSYRILEGVLTSFLHDPNVHAVVNNFRDITERVRAEEALRGSEERFAKAFRSSPLAITISTRAEGRYLDVNQAFLQMLGYVKEEVVGRTVEELGIWVDPQDRLLLIQQLSEHGRVPALQASFRTRSGETRQTEVSAELIQLDGVPCVLAITRDVTEAKRLEEQFRQAQKMEAVGQLAGGVAHDFNNMLGVIIGYSELSQERLDPEHPSRKHIEQIKKAAERAAGLTRQLLAFSRQQVLQPRILDLNAVVYNVSKMLLRMVGEDVSLVFVPGVPLGSVKADLGQIEQVLMNLVVNARDAMPRGGEIKIETLDAELESYAQRQPTVRPGPYVMLSVSDNGCGMDAKTLERIFEPFFTTKGPTEGTGLGLSTVYGIVTQSDGHIWVDSEPGNGTTFKIYFPRLEESAGSLIAPKAEPVFARGTETILLVEDDEPLRKLTLSLLQGSGYKVLEAENGPAAIDLAKGYGAAIDLLLTDVIMPAMGGGELARLMLAARPSLKLLYISGYTGTSIARQGIPGIENALLQKPFTKESLLTKVRAVLDQ